MDDHTLSMINNRLSTIEVKVDAILKDIERLSAALDAAQDPGPAHSVEGIAYE